MGTISCHSNQSSYPTGIKNITFRSPYLRMVVCNMERIGLSVSEEMSFENVDGRRMPVQLLPIIFLDSDFCHNYLHTPVVLN